VADKWCVKVEGRTEVWVGQRHQLVHVGVVINIVIINTNTTTTTTTTITFQILLMVTRYTKWVNWLFRDSGTQHWCKKWQWEIAIEGSSVGTDRNLIFAMGLEIVTSKTTVSSSNVFGSVQIVDRLLLCSQWNGHISFRPRPAAIILRCLVHSS
jgi:hypothetical protein